MLTTAELKSLLKTRGLRLTKRLGQHHLIDPSAIRRIVEACDLSGGETVVEIGAGLGALTEALAQRARRIVAVEVDRGIAALAAERMKPLANVTVACQDILALEDQTLKEAVVVGAIPYHITSLILVWLSERRQLIRRAVLVMQEEVAQRLVAKPGTKSYGRLSLLAQYGWRVRARFTVPRRAFFPQPEVDSACVQFIPQAQPPAPVEPHGQAHGTSWTASGAESRARAHGQGRGPSRGMEQETVFFAVVKAAFSQRRKTLANCLSAASEFKLSRSQVAALLKTLGHSPSVRGEQLSLEQFAALANELGSTPTPNYKSQSS